MTHWHMPPEWTPHERTWMAFPSAGYTLGDTEAQADAARHTWAQVATTVARFEPVSMLVTEADQQIAADLLDDHVTLVTAELDDAWMRDIGPTFVVGDDGSLGAVDWIFNGWGQQSWAQWGKDKLIGEFVGRAAGAAVINASIVNEGGGFHVDGRGTVLLTETVQLDPGRNPGATKQQIEDEVHRVLGTTHAIWLPRGLTRDNEEFGTRGHVDIVATFPSPGTVLVHHQENPEHPDYEISQTVISLLEKATDATGERLTVVPIPAPATLTDDEGPVDYSYVNHLVVNGGVVACAFEDAHDERALNVLQEVYPGREVVGVDSREIFVRGGGVHCITQQQPAV